MKQRKLTSLLFSFLLILLTISSCKKDSNVQATGNNETDIPDKIKTVSVGADGIATITTVNGNQYTQDVAIKSSKGNLPTSSITSNGDSTLIFTIPISTLGPKSGGNPSTNVVDPNGPGGFQPITATVTSVNGFVTVGLSSYSQYYNGITLTATVFGITSYGSGGSFFVQFVQTSGGVVVGSSTVEYSYHF